jgi:hypothetical protein
VRSSRGGSTRSRFVGRGGAFRPLASLPGAVYALANVAFATLFARYAQADLELIVMDWLQGGVFDHLIDVIVALFETYLVLSAPESATLAVRPTRRPLPEDASIAR